MFATIREDIHSIFERDPASRSVAEILLCYPGLHAVWMYRLSHWFWVRRRYLIGRWLSHLGRWLTGIEIHPGAQIGKSFFIDHGMGVVIGETAEVGDDVTLYHGVTLGGTTWNKGKRHPTLENGVVVGAGAKVLGPITVGENARIGSNAVVNKAVPAGATAVGIPGRIICKDMDADCQQEKLRQDMASKIGFDAYGMTPDMPDPIAQSIRKMLDHMHAVDEKVNAMSEALESMGSDCGKSLPEIHDDVFEEESEAASGAPAAAATKVD